MATFIATQDFMPSPAEASGNVGILGALASRVPKPASKGLYVRRIAGGDYPESKDDKVSKKGRSDKQAKSTGALLLMIVVILITIIIFVTIIAAYDVIREKIANKYAEQALRNVKSENKKEDIERTLIANEQSYKATVSFGIFSVIIALGVLPILFIIYYKLVNAAS